MGTQTKATTRISKRGKSIVVESTRTPDINELLAGNIDVDKVIGLVQSKAKQLEKNAAPLLEQQGQFIQLRAEGLSFAKIAKQLNVSKPTLLKWQVELSKEVHQARFFAIETLVEEYKLRKQHRIQGIAVMLQKAQKELDKRDFAELSTSDLFKLVKRLEEKLAKEINSVSCETGEVKNIFEEDHFTQGIRMYID